MVKLIGVLVWASAHSSPTAPSQDKSVQSSRRSFESGHSPFVLWVLAPLTYATFRSRSSCHWRKIGICLSCLFGSGLIKTSATASFNFQILCQRKGNRVKRGKVVIERGHLVHSLQLCPEAGPAISDYFSHSATSLLYLDPVPHM